MAKIAVVTARFNEIVTERLKRAALMTLEKVKGVEVFEAEVEGSFELPLAAQVLIQKHSLDGVVCLGAVIRGQTSHYDYVCSQSASGLMKVQLETGVPCSFGVLTTENLEQALDRAGGKLGNKGNDAARAVLDLVELKSSGAKSVEFGE